MLVDREVALHHRALRAKEFDAGFDIRAPQCGEFLGARRYIAQMKIPIAVKHAQTAELDAEIWVLRQRAQVFAPDVEDFVAFTVVRRQAKDAAGMIDDDAGVGEGARQIRDVG